MGQIATALKAIRLGARVELILPSKLKIDRSQPFDPAKFIGEGWTIWKGPLDGNGLEGDEQQDEKSLALTEVDLSHVSFLTMLRPNEPYMTSIESQKPLKAAGHIHADAMVFKTLWDNKELIPEIYKRLPNGDVRYMYFDGTMLRRSGGRRFILCLYFDDGKWYWGVYDLDDDLHVVYLSVVLG
jgi:hypothetical protein